MNAEQSPHISVIDPVGPAIEKTKLILFSPFDIGRWFVIGFCAWLAYLCQGSPAFNFPYDWFRRHPAYSDRLNDIITNYWPLVLTIGIIGLFFVLVLSIVFLWLSSRGEFMFLHCVAQNKAEVKTPWRKFQRHGLSLFLFRLVLAIIGFVFVAVMAGLVVLTALICRADFTEAGPVAFVIVLLLAVLLTLVAIIFMLLFKFTSDFVVPLMYLRNCSCLDAWRQFLALLSANKGKFTLYVLFQIVIALAIAAIVVAAACLTCCIAGCILMIPYIGTVLFLPLLVFQRAYSLLYLRQYGPDFDAFAPAAMD